MLLVLGSYFVGNRTVDDAGAIKVGDSEVDIANSLFAANRSVDTGGAIDYLNSDGVLAHLTIAENTSGSLGTLSLRGDSQIEIVNSLFEGESGAAGYAIWERDNISNATITNSVFHNNALGSLSDLTGGSRTNYNTGAAANANASATGNLDGDPRFRQDIFEPGLTGTWTAVAYDAAEGTTTFTDATASFPPFGFFFSRFLNADVAGDDAWAVTLRNTATTITVPGNFTALAAAGNTYRVQSWIPVDDASSVVDAGIVASVFPLPLTEDVANRPRPVDVITGGLTYDSSAHEVQVAPLFIELASFTGQRLSDLSVQLHWVTSTEIDNAGFNIYRSIGSGPMVKINSSIIPADPDAFGGASYSFIDTDAAGQSATMTYFLEDVDFNGVTKLHGPVTLGAEDATSGLPAWELYR